MGSKTQAAMSQAKAGLKSASKAVGRVLPAKDKRISQVTRFDAGLKGTGTTTVTNLTSRQAVKVANAPYTAKKAGYRAIGLTAASGASGEVSKNAADLGAELSQVKATVPTVNPDGTRTDPSEENKSSGQKDPWALNIDRDNNG